MESSIMEQVSYSNIVINLLNVKTRAAECTDSFEDEALTSPFSAESTKC